MTDKTPRFQVLINRRNGKATVRQFLPSDSGNYASKLWGELADEATAVRQIRNGWPSRDEQGRLHLAWLPGDDITIEVIR